MVTEIKTCVDTDWRCFLGSQTKRGPPWLPIAGSTDVSEVVVLAGDVLTVLQLTVPHKYSSQSVRCYLNTLTVTGAAIMCVGGHRWHYTVDGRKAIQFLPSFWYQLLEKSLYKSTTHELWCLGDEILSINGLSVQGLSHREAISIFKTIKAGIVTIHIARRDSGLATNRCSLALLHPTSF